MKSQLFDIRREYKKGRLTPGNLNDNPFEQFDHWLNDAIHSDEYEPTAMTVATVSSDGHPSTRTVLLKGVENGRFIFFTNYNYSEYKFKCIYSISNNRRKKCAKICKRIFKLFCILLYRINSSTRI